MTIIKKKIAIVGSGISGLTCAYLLNKTHDVTLFEADERLGGHTHTVDIEHEGVVRSIDTGFIVFNNWNYPHFIKLMEKLGVKDKKTQMSFSVHNTHTGLEYNGHTLSSLFSQKSNLINPKFWKLLIDIVRFNKISKKFYLENKHQSLNTLVDFLDQHSFNDYFRTNYILPMCAAIWSISLDEASKLPFSFFVQFFYNHGLLNITNRPQWYVLVGGSKSYIPHLTKSLGDQVLLNAKVTAVNRTNDLIDLTVEQQGELKHFQFDEVILACHSDQSFEIIKDKSAEEEQVLGNIAYQLNDVVLHQDANMMPSLKASWASWNYRINQENNTPAIVTYCMNILQSLDKDAPDYFVTLNQTKAINPDKILAEFSYAHPVFNPQSIKAQGQRSLICGVNNTHFAGAYWYNGFHEDGVKSALDVCQRFGITL